MSNGQSFAYNVFLLSTVYIIFPTANAAPLNTTVPEDAQGWTSQPDGRGTLDIIWSCVFTIFLCAWSAQCVNVSSLSDSPFALLRRKLYLTGLAIVGPEFTFMLALGQWVSARRSVSTMRKAGYTGWTMTQAFFADMGGFILKAPDFPPFPIDAAQMQWLIVNEHLRYPSDYDKHFIDDKNKNDALVRMITVCQTLWFTINCICRGAQHLAITTFELTTLAFIYCTLATTFCWLHKPSDVGRAVVVYTNTNIRDIVSSAGENEWQPYMRTPLDFISRREWSWTLYWKHWTAILRKCNIQFAPKVRPMNRMPNDNFPPMSEWGLVLFSILSTTYAAIFFSAWHFAFPTAIERLLWHVAAISNLGCIVVAWLVDTTVFRITPLYREYQNRWRRDHERSIRHRAHARWWSNSSLHRPLSRIADRIRNNSFERDPMLYVPIKALVPMSAMGTIYCFARAYILIEDIIGLRSLPASAYGTVEWSLIFPHI